MFYGLIIIFVAVTVAAGYFTMRSMEKRLDSDKKII